MSDNKEYDINTCFADDSETFWNRLKEVCDYNVFGGVYSYLYDPDGHSNKLYEFHERLWNNQRIEFNEKLKLNIPQVTKEKDKCELHESNNVNFRLGSDSIISIYFHRWEMQPLLHKIAEEINENLLETEIENDSYNKWDNIKKFFWCYLHKTNTIGGFVVFPRHKYSINQERGILSKINDRFDLTLECIRRYYIYLKNTSEKNYNPLFNYLDKDKEFFEMFGSFKNYVDFFCLQDWVNDKYEVLDLLGDTKTTLLNADKVWKENKVLPCDFETDDETKVKKWWNLYYNLMYRLKERNKRIDEILP